MSTEEIALHDAEAGPVPVESLEWFRRKGLAVGFSFLDVWREEHAHAFTAAKVMREDVLEALQAEIARSLEEGLTYEQFAANAEERLTALGWWGDQPVRDPVTGKIVEVHVPSRLATIFHTNARVARAAGQWKRIERTQDTHPYLLYSIGPSRVHREQHLAWAGLVLPVDHKFWDTHFPPNGWGCRCYVRQISERTLERLRESGIRGPGGGIIKIREKAPRIAYARYTNPRTGVKAKVPRGIDPGWDYNPGKVRRDPESGAPVTVPTPPEPTPGALPTPTPAENRRAYLEGLGVGREAIERDLLEQPPPPELTRDGLRAWAEGLDTVSDRLARGRMLIDTNARDLRVQFRRAMRAMAPELFSRDIEFRRDRYELGVRLLPPKAAAVHKWQGGIELAPSVGRELGKAMRALARGRSPTDEGWSAIRTMIHEELHGHSVIGEYSYVESAQGLEEATVETVARALTQRLRTTVSRRAPKAIRSLGLPDLRKEGDGVRLDPEASSGGSYQGWVNGLAVAVHRVTGLEGEELQAHIVNALVTAHFVADGAPETISPVEHIMRIANALAPDDPGRMRRELNAVMISKYQWTEASGWHEENGDVADPEKLISELGPRDIEGAKAVIRAFVERDGNCPGETVGMLAMMQGSGREIASLEELDSYRREISGKTEASGRPFE